MTMPGTKSANDLAAERTGLAGVRTLMAADRTLMAWIRTALDRTTLFDPADTNAYLWIDRHHDGFPDVRVERLGDVALVLNYADSATSDTAEATTLPNDWLDAWGGALSVEAIWEQRRPRGGGDYLRRQARCLSHGGLLHERDFSARRGGVVFPP